MEINKKLAEELGVSEGHVAAVVNLLDEGNTIPFIARYRKEMHGDMGDEKLRALEERLKYLRGLEEKKASVLQTMTDLGVLTPELKKKMNAALTLTEVEDLYRPYRPKRRTRAMIAKEKGLEPLAALLLEQTTKRLPAEEALAYVDTEKGVDDVEAALDGASDIIAEQLSDRADFRTLIRTLTWDYGFLTSEVRDETVESVYETYYHFETSLKKVAGYQVLAISRAEKEKVLSVAVKAPEERIIGRLEYAVIKGRNQAVSQLLRDTIRDAYSRLIAPAIEREIMSDLREKAEEGGMKVFGDNLRQLLMQPPIAGQTVLGWDPGFRNGCKLVVVDPHGKILDAAIVYPTMGQRRVEEAKTIVKGLIKKYGITLISVGNGTASRESEAVIAEIIAEIPQKVQYIFTNEAGASVYSASEQATKELPDYTVEQRSAASIARRVQDPLAELVKIDPKAIGVGQYQHDMNQKKLSDVLRGVVEDCVNSVGVDLNTASAALLGYVSGITPTIAGNIVAWRDENGVFTDRKQLLKVSKLGPKAFEQCAGFLRIRGGKNPLDATAVHPESYETALAILKEASLKPSDILGGTLSGLGQKVNLSRLEDEYGVGALTVKDIIGELEKPSRDPRDEMPKPILSSKVLAMEDLQPGMRLKGTVRNVVDFGAFVDIGVHQDGLVHISQLANRRVGHPSEIVSVGDIVDVEVLTVDVKKKRIGLSMRLKDKINA